MVEVPDVAISKVETLESVAAKFQFVPGVLRNLLDEEYALFIQNEHTVEQSAEHIKYQVSTILTLIPPGIVFADWNITDEWSQTDIVRDSGQQENGRQQTAPES